MASTILPLLTAFQAAFSAYNLYLCSISISKLLEYEEKAKKAAEWSNTASDQLWRTRTTQASGTLAVLATFLSSLYTTFSLPSAKLTTVALATLNIGILLAAREHVGRFWKGSKKIPLPGVGYYNDALGNTVEVRLNSAYLAVGWAVVGGLGLVL